METITGRSSGTPTSSTSPVFPVSLQKTRSGTDIYPSRGRFGCRGASGARLNRAPEQRDQTGHGPASTGTAALAADAAGSIAGRDVGGLRGGMQGRMREGMRGRMQGGMWGRTRLPRGRPPLPGALTGCGGPSAGWWPRGPGARGVPDHGGWAA